VFTGGAPVFPSLLDRLSAACPEARVTALYGSTEAEPIAELAWSEASASDRQHMREGGGLLAGKPVDRIDLRIMADRSGEAVGPLDAAAFDAMMRPKGEAGEIVVAGEHVLAGYLDGRGDREGKIHVGGRVWHRTGDAGYVGASGRLWLLGRASAKVADERGVVYPLAVECVADGVEGVRRTALVSHEAGRLLVVEAETERRAPVERRLEEALGEAVERFVFVDQIPVDRRHNAKVDYPALRRQLRRVV